MEAGKYTAKELLEQAGFEDVEFGKVRVRIGGVRGIVEPDHKIKIQRKANFDVMVGEEVKTI